MVRSLDVSATGGRALKKWPFSRQQADPHFAGLLLGARLTNTRADLERCAILIDVANSARAGRARIRAGRKAAPLAHRADRHAAIPRALGHREIAVVVVRALGIVGADASIACVAPVAGAARISTVGEPGQRRHPVQTPGTDEGQAGEMGSRAAHGAGLPLAQGQAHRGATSCPLTRSVRRRLPPEEILKSAFATTRGEGRGTDRPSSWLPDLNVLRRSAFSSASRPGPSASSSPRERRPRCAS